MSIPIEENPNEAAEPAHEAPSKCSIAVKLGRDDERVIGVEIGRSIRVVLETIAAERGCGVEELVLYREGDDEPLSEIIIVDTHYPHRHRHHVHHINDVDVTVYYQAGHQSHRFMRHATVNDVLKWAIAKFNVDESMATEFELALHGETTELPGSEHVGHLAGHARELALDLVRGDIANGAYA
jgi:hypothetical protein